MEHKHADEVMKQVELYYRGDFLLNGSMDISNLLRWQFQKKDAHKYNGVNGIYGTNKMSATPQCKKMPEGYSVSHGGTVYGPYVHFAAGTYYAEFFVEGALDRCLLSVCSADGLVCEAEANQLQENGHIILPFTLEREADNVEFKTYNQGENDLVFHKVIVRDRLHTAEEDSDRGEEGQNMYIEDEQLQEIFQSLTSYQAHARTMEKALVSGAECALPLNTHVRFLKRVLRKMMKPFTIFQIDFNRKTASEMVKLNRENQLLTEAFCALAAKLQEGEEKEKDVSADSQERLNKLEQQLQKVWDNGANVNKDLSSIWQAHTSLRQEVFYEIDRRARQITDAGNEKMVKSTQEPVICESAEEKIKQLNGAVRLNLGSGNLPVEGYLSVDARKLPTVDIIADVGKLPYGPDSVDEIFSAHLIEHFTMEVMKRELIPYWRSLLKPNGIFRVIFPDLEAMIADYHDGKMRFEQLALNIMGGQDYQLDYHYAVYSAETVCNMLEKCGFHDIKVIAKGRENGGCRETEITALK